MAAFARALPKGHKFRDDDRLIVKVRVEIVEAHPDQEQAVGMIIEAEGRCNSFDLETSFEMVQSDKVEVNNDAPRQHNLTLDLDAETVVWIPEEGKLKT